MSTKWQYLYKDKLVTHQQAARLVQPGDKVVFSSNGKAVHFGYALSERKAELEAEVKKTGKKVRVASIWSHDMPFLHQDYGHIFDVTDAFVMRYTREEMRERRSDWNPAVFGLCDGVRHLNPDRGCIYHDADYYVCKVTPPNSAGFCSFSIFHWQSPTACKTARHVIAEVDPALPWCFGEYIHVNDIDYLLETPSEAATGFKAFPTPPQDEYDMAQVIGAHVASLVHDGDTIEIGTGTPTESVLEYMVDKNDIGADSEQIYPMMTELQRRGVINNSRKNIDRGKTLTTCLFFSAGDPRGQASLDFVRDNPAVEFRDISYLANIPRLASIDNLVSVNCGIGIDLKGQPVIDHLGRVPISGPGGQVEYTIGAHYSKGGRSVLCLLSTAKDKTISRIVPEHPMGTGIEVPFAYVDYLVTEHGIVNLDCKSMRERAEAIISIADPKFRDELKEAAKKLFWP